MKSLVVLFVLSLSSAEYWIPDILDKMNLYYKFYNLNKRLLYEDLSFTLSLNDIRGTLLYSYDNERRQTLLRLSAVDAPRLIVECQNVDHVLLLSDLCNCKGCRYTLLAMRVRMKGIQMTIDCNRGQAISFECPNKVLSNYPTPRLDKNVTAIMWLVNTPGMGDLYPNHEQLSGCIFNATYNGKIISMEKSSNKISDTCKSACGNNVCNGGICHETYDLNPICDCHTTFENGDFCNSKSVEVNGLYELTQQMVTPSTKIKISWKSDSTEIFSLENVMKTVFLKVSVEKSNMKFRYQMNISDSIRIFESTIFKNYQPNKQTILRITFDVEDVNFELINEKKETHHSSMKIYSNLQQEMFTLKVLIETGLFGFAYKFSSEDYGWKSNDFINISRFIATTTQNPERSLSVKEKPKDNISWNDEKIFTNGIIGIVIACVAVLLMLGVIILLTIFVFHKNKNYSYRRCAKEPSKQTEEL